MSKKSGLSPVMEHTLAIAMQHGRLVRLQGGFWTYPDCAIKHEIDPPIPTWYVTILTVTALVDRDYLRISRSNKFGPQEVKPTGVLPS